MHVSTEQLHKLAQAYVEEKLLNKEQVQIKRHMAECDSCYEIFCAEYLILHQLYKIGMLPLEEMKAAPCEKVLLKIQTIKDKLNVLKETMQPDWNFIKMPQLAAARGEERKTEEIFENCHSEYSFIKGGKEHVIIQLDGDVFPVHKLKVRICSNGNEMQYDFLYNTETECYQVILDRKNLSEESVIEIIEVENEK